MAEQNPQSGTPAAFPRAALTPEERAQIVAEVKAALVRDIYAEIGRTIVGRVSMGLALLVTAVLAFATARGWINVDFSSR